MKEQTAEQQRRSGELVLPVDRGDTDQPLHLETMKSHGGYTYEGVWDASSAGAYCSETAVKYKQANLLKSRMMSPASAKENYSR